MPSTNAGAWSATSRTCRRSCRIGVMTSRCHVVTASTILWTSALESARPWLPRHKAKKQYWHVGVPNVLEAKAGLFNTWVGVDAHREIPK